MSVEDDFKAFIDGLQAFSAVKSTEHNPISCDTRQADAGAVSISNDRCTYTRDGNALKIWFLKAGESAAPDEPSMKMTWTDTGWEHETFLGPGLWDSEDLAAECIDRLIEQASANDFRF